MADVTALGLYETYPDLMINVAAEQERLLSHDALVIQHPFIGILRPASSKNGSIWCWRMALPRAPGRMR